MTTTDASLSAASAHFQAVLQIFSACYRNFVDHQIRSCQSIDGTAHLKELNAKYAKRYQFNPSQGSDGWDTSFLLFLWQSDGGLNTFDANDNESTSRTSAAPYVPRLFALDTAVKAYCPPERLAQLPAMVAIDGHQVWVGDANSFYRIRNTRNEWAHGKISHMHAYAQAAKAMQKYVLALPQTYVVERQRNALLYHVSTLMYMRDVHQQSESQQRKERETLHTLKMRMRDAHAEIGKLQQTISTLQQQHVHVQGHQSEQQLLVEALLSHMTNTNYDTRLTIADLQTQVQTLQSADQDELLLATIVQLQHLVVVLRKDNEDLQQQLQRVQQEVQSLASPAPGVPAEAEREMTPVTTTKLTDQHGKQPRRPPTATVGQRRHIVAVVVAALAMMYTVWLTSQGMIPDGVIGAWPF